MNGERRARVKRSLARRLTHLDLCSGIGGFHLGAEWAGFETVGFSEVELYCCKLLAEKWPQITNYGDLRRADFSGLRGRITVLSAGVPCQPASVAGKRRGKGDDRWLWPAVLDVVERVKPAWCIFENPVGILSLDEFGGILLRLGDLGYEVRLFSVPANSVGAKHRRQRVFIVANRSCELPYGSGRAWNGRDQFGLEGGQQQDRTFGASASRQSRMESSGSGEALADADRAGLEGRDERQWEDGHSGSGGQSVPEFRKPFAQFRMLADGVSEKSHQAGGQINGDAEEAGSREVLPELRDQIRAQGLQRQIGGSGGIRETKVLRHEMHGNCKDEARADTQGLWSTGEETQRSGMPELWNQYPPLNPSQRQGLEQQCPGEFRDAVQFVSHVIASRSGRDLSKETQIAVLRLRQAIVQIGVVQHLQDAKEKIWNALPQAERVWTISAACSSYWTEWWPGLTPLSQGRVKDRSHRLKALGNSVVPAQCYPFFQAICEIEARVISHSALSAN